MWCVLLIHEFLQKSTEDFSTEAALVDRGVTLSYAEFSGMVNTVSAGLKKLGCNLGDRVAFFGQNSSEYAIVYFACSQMGLVLVPLNAHLMAAEAAWILNDARPKLIFSDAEYVDRLAEVCEKLVPPERRFVVGQAVQNWQNFLMLLEDSPAENSYSPPLSEPHDVFVQMYTSGTTGMPKGVMLSHQNMTSLVTSWLEEMTLESSRSRFMLATPLFHVGALVVFLSSIAAGAALVILPKFEPELALQTLLQEKISHTLLVPAMVQRLLLTMNNQHYEFPHLKQLVYGASPMPLAVLKRAINVFECEFLQGYGLTETSGVALCLRSIDHHFESEKFIPQRLSSAGKAVSCCEVRIIDEEGVSLEVGLIGEIAVKGSNVMLGYYDNPVATSQAFVDGWLRTGDLGTLDNDGYITVVDRMKDMIDYSGENVYPVEIENIIMEHADVAEVAVVGISKAVMGEEVTAIIVMRDDNAQDNRDDKTRKDNLAEEISVICRHKLAKFKCPTRIEFASELPRTPAGKLQKHLLRDAYSSREL